MSVWKLTLPIFMKGVHPVFHIFLIHRRNPHSILEAKRAKHQESWGKQRRIMESQPHHWLPKENQKRHKYIVSWKGFCIKNNSWDPRGDLQNSSKLRNEFNYRLPKGLSRQRSTTRKKWESIQFHHVAFWFNLWKEHRAFNTELRCQLGDSFMSWSHCNNLWQVRQYLLLQGQF